MLFLLLLLLLLPMLLLLLCALYTDPRCAVGVFVTAAERVLVQDCNLRGASKGQGPPGPPQQAKDKKKRAKGRHD